MTNRRLMVLPALIFVVCTSSALAQREMRGLVANSPDAFTGYTLFAPLDRYDTHLINMKGQVVHSWKHEFVPANSVFLLPNGDLLRCAKVDHSERFGTQGPSGGRIEKFDWDGNKIWDFVVSDDRQHQHHDIEPLPNGNVLAIVWDHVSKDDAIAAGRKPDAIADEGIWPEKIIEVKQTGPTNGEVVWQWRSWDHLIQDADPDKSNYGKVGEHPELIDVNVATRPKADWMHANGIDYNPELDQIAISMRSFGEFFVIDHSTTSEEAAGHNGGQAGRGGDILYRWGNPANYRAGSASDRTLFGQHDARWVEAGRPGAGNITVFNNGSGRPDGDYSSVDEIVPPTNTDGSYAIEVGSAFAPKQPIWSYTAKNKMEFYSSFISGAERLPNGNTLICAGASGDFIEVTPNKEIAWRYLNPFIKPGADAPPRDARPNAGQTDRRGPVGDRRNDQSRIIDARNTNDLAAPPARQRRRGGSPQSPHIVFRVVRYAPGYPGLAGRELNPRGE